MYSAVMDGQCTAREMPTPARLVDEQALIDDLLAAGKTYVFNPTRRIVVIIQLIRMVGILGNR